MEKLDMKGEKRSELRSRLDYIYIYQYGNVTRSGNISAYRVTLPDWGGGQYVARLSNMFSDRASKLLL